jgi:hypothetical protein
MADFAKTMAGTAVGIGSIALVGESMKMIPHDFGAPMKGKGKRKQMRKGKQVPFVKGAANLMIGTALLGGAAGIVNKM